MKPDTAYELSDKGPEFNSWCNPLVVKNRSSDRLFRTLSNNHQRMAYLDNYVSRAAYFIVPSTSQGIKIVSATSGHARFEQKEQVGGRLVAIKNEVDLLQRRLPVQTYQRQLNRMALEDGTRSQTPTRRSRKGIRAGLVSVDLHDPHT